MARSTSIWETAISRVDPTRQELRYRGVRVEELCAKLNFSQAWSLLVDNHLNTELPPGEPLSLEFSSGDVRADMQSAVTQLAPVWGFRPLLDIGADQARSDLARASVMTLSFVAQALRGRDSFPVSQREIALAESVTERFLLRWRGEADPVRVQALDVYWVALADHGLSPSTVTTRHIASTGADAAACISAGIAALSGPLMGGAPDRILRTLKAVDADGGARSVVDGTLIIGERLLGFGHPTYELEDPRTAILRDLCVTLDAPRSQAALEYEKAGLAALAEHKPDVRIAPNVELWGAVLLDFVGVPPEFLVAMFACGRTAGWSAHIVEQAETGRLPHIEQRYTGPPARGLDDV